MQNNEQMNVGFETSRSLVCCAGMGSSLCGGSAAEFLLNGLGGRTKGIADAVRYINTLAKNARDH